ncbi:hypothetical protein [Psychroserpens damuponensis]|uniref:hypothetical protein n=1 Tax=Psychroserpens damuponensis TaxID=943936 RepID=UPI000A71AF87|nr:hypothetical protein [Psychroserpens damuponensis]
MKTLKITLLLLAVLLLTVSGQSSDAIADTNQEDVQTYNKTDLLAHTRKGIKLPNNG